MRPIVGSEPFEKIEIAQAYAALEVSLHAIKIVKVEFHSGYVPDVSIMSVEREWEMKTRIKRSE